MGQIDQLTAFLTANGMEAKAWKGMHVFLNGIDDLHSLGKDIKAFIELDEPWTEDADYLWQGCALRVQCHANEPVRWRRDRAKQVKHGVMLDLARIDKATDGGLFGPLGNDVVDDWRKVVAG